jgi:hypothetical protein
LLILIGLGSSELETWKGTKGWCEEGARVRVCNALTI